MKNTNNLEKQQVQQHDPMTLYYYSLISAATSGLVGAYCAFFFEGMKKRLQSDRPLPKISNGVLPWFKESFRGAGSFAISLTPTSVIQQMLHMYMQDAYKDSKLGVVASGAVGGFFSTAVENVILEQQQKKIGSKQAVSNLFAQGYTRPWRSLPLIMGREAVFGTSYLEGSKKGGKFVAEHCGDEFEIVGKVGVGIAGSLLSHPLDTMATTMQCNNFAKISEAYRFILLQKGMKGFYQGGLARVGLFTTAMLSIDTTKEFVYSKLLKM